MNQEPYGWMLKGQHQGMIYKEKPKGLASIPLYTAPQDCYKEYIKLAGKYQELLLKEKLNAPQYRELSREEVRNVWLSLPYDPDNAPYLFAHAIIKKASEK